MFSLLRHHKKAKPGRGHCCCRVCCFRAGLMFPCCLDSEMRILLTKAQDILGSALWDNILELQRDGKQLPRETSVHINSLRESFLVAHAPSAAGSVNIYLTAINPRID